MFERRIRFAVLPLSFSIMTANKVPLHRGLYTGNELYDYTLHAIRGILKLRIDLFGQSNSSKMYKYIDDFLYRNNTMIFLYYTANENIQQRFSISA